MRVRQDRVLPRILAIPWDTWQSIPPIATPYRGGNERDTIVSSGHVAHRCDMPGTATARQLSFAIEDVGSSKA